MSESTVEAGSILSAPGATDRSGAATSSTAFFRALFAAVSLVIVGLFLLAAPAFHTEQAISDSPLAGSRGVPAGAPVGIPSATRLGPRASRVLPLREGPSDDYAVIGSVGRDAPLEVVGRSDDGLWLAVSVAPGAALYAWVPSRQVVDGPDLRALPVKPVVLIPSPSNSR
jgi:hypothetical protein